MKGLIFCVLLGAMMLRERMFAGEAAEVNLAYVAKRAEQRAHKPFHSPRADLPEALRADKLDYDKYREIEFRHEKALWLPDNLPFRVEFFHPGYLYQEPVHIHEFTSTHVQPIRFVLDFFNYRGLNIQKQIPVDTGYAGFKLLYPLHDKNKWDEVGSFLGASYFRLLGKNQHYGQSARGLAIDCAEGDRSEEFPIFTDWWLGKPQRDEKQLKLYAILDSVSCAGAYEFTLTPGDATRMAVEAIIYFREETTVRAVAADRKPIKTIGLAPLTSMYWFGKGGERKFDDYRPEVHDSDGLLVHMENGEVLWQPVNNPAKMQHQSFVAKNVRGFGLLQRERDFNSYQDLFNFYHQTPSVWVKPHGQWGEGELHLVELSTHYEGLDNIVAFWNPKTRPPPLQKYQFGYTLVWTMSETNIEISPAKDKVLATRLGADARDAKKREFVIDFGGPKVSAMNESAPPQAVASCSDGASVVGTQVFRNPNNNSWRVVVRLQPKPENKEPINIRCALQKGEEVLTETWTYHWNPP
jgi:periplasmic glucans biosynthesis protein